MYYLRVRGKTLEEATAAVSARGCVLDGQPLPDDPDLYFIVETETSMSVGDFQLALGLGDAVVDAREIRSRAEGTAFARQQLLFGG